jgi:capsular exopolysaccharide synthesis family protein
VSEAPRYATLRDYLRVLRERRVLIAVCVAVCAIAALALSIREDKVYQAESALAFHDTSEESDLLGTPTPQRLTSAERAAQGAEAVGRAPIVQRVAAQLRGRMAPSQVAGAATAHVDPRSNLVIIQTKAGDAQLAARLADAYAKATFRDAVDRARLSFRKAADQVSRQFATVARTARDPVTRSLYADRIARLQVLARTSIPVDVVRRAAVPANPVSPKPVRNTLLGALLGLTLGLLLAFGRDSLDRRLRGVEEISTELDWPVLGHVRQDAMGRIAPMGGNGHKVLDAADLEAFRILRANLRFLNVDEPPRIVLVTSAMPGEGKTTVAGSLAYASAASGRRTLLLECDLRRPMLAERMGLKPSPGLIDLLLEEADVASITRAVPTAGHKGAGNGHRPEAPALSCIPAGRPVARAAELLGSRRFAQTLTQLVGAYDAIVIDSSPLLSVADTLEIMPRADAVLLCVRARQTTRDQVHAARQAIERVPGRPTGVVVTGLRPRDEVDYGYYSYAYAQDA